MVKLRIVKTSSSAKAVQAVHYCYNKRVIVKHFGSSHTDDELAELLETANQWIKEYSRQLVVFPNEEPAGLIPINQCEFLGVYFSFLYEVISTIQLQIGFTQLETLLFTDMAIIRLLEPASKLRSIELLESYFGIKHRRQNYYKVAPKWLKLKEAVETKVVEFAKHNYEFNFDLLIYCFMM
jgi:hypothetical protein